MYMLILPIFLRLFQGNNKNKQEKKTIYEACYRYCEQIFYFVPIKNRDFNQDKHAVLIKYKLKQEPLSYVISQQYIHFFSFEPINYFLWVKTK